MLDMRRRCRQSSVARCDARIATAPAAPPPRAFFLNAEPTLDEIVWNNFERRQAAVYGASHGWWSVTPSPRPRRPSDARHNPIVKCVPIPWRSTSKLEWGETIGNPTTNRILGCTALGRSQIGRTWKAYALNIARIGSQRSYATLPASSDGSLSLSNLYS